MIWLLQVSKIQDGGQNSCRFPILIIISQPFKLKTQVRYPNMRYELYTVNIITIFQLLQVPKIQNGRCLVSKWHPKWPPFSYFDHNFPTIHTRNTSKVSNHMFWGMRNLPETLLRCFNSCKYPKSKIAAH